MVPFRSLRYRSGATQIWGLNVLRTVRWRNELSTLAAVPPGRGMEGVRQRPLATLVGIEAPPASTNLEIKPYALATMTTDRSVRSEEHTSELQSQSNLVCRLLLE